MEYLYDSPEDNSAMAVAMAEFIVQQAYDDFIYWRNHVENQPVND